jgi:hypothetical protein
MLVCYDFHYGIFDEKRDLMFAIEPKLFSIGTIILPKPIRLEYAVISIPSIDIRLVEQVLDVHVQQISLLLIQITILHDAFKEHLPQTFFQP